MPSRSRVMNRAVRSAGVHEQYVTLLAKDFSSETDFYLLTSTHNNAFIDMLKRCHRDIDLTAQKQLLRGDQLFFSTYKCFAGHFESAEFAASRATCVIAMESHTVRYVFTVCAHATLMCRIKYVSQSVSQSVTQLGRPSEEKVPRTRVLVNEHHLHAASPPLNSPVTRW